MAEMHRSYKYIIEASIAQMTESERIVADYFINLSTIDDLSAEYVSEKLGVSLATLSRFAKKCGVSGYREFTTLYKDSFVGIDEIKDENNQLVLSSYQELLNRQYSVVDEKQISSIAQAMSKCHHLYIAGRGNSGLSAEEMASRFKWLGIDASSIRDPEEMKLSTLFLQSDDMVIGLSISGKQKELIYLLDQAAKSGCYTVLATGNNNKLLKDKVNELVLVPVIKNLNYGNLISPQLPLLLLGDMIYGAYVAQNEEAAKAAQQSVQDVLYK